LESRQFKQKLKPAAAVALVVLIQIVHLRLNWFCIKLVSFKQNCPQILVTSKIYAENNHEW